MTRRSTSLISLLLLLPLLLTSCTFGDKKDGLPADGPNILRVLASSEVADLESSGVLDELKKATGVDIRLTESGTLDASSVVASGGADGTYDALWLSSNRYFSLLPGSSAKVATSTKIMASPVVLGVKQEVAKQLGWSQDTPPAWADIHKAAASGKLSYAMTNPAASNSGFSTLVAVATGLSGGGAALDAPRTKAVEPQLKEFFSAQKLTAGSTGWLTDKFLSDPNVGGLFSYEASLLALNKSGKLDKPLAIITPSDGVITADYPFSLLSSAKQEKRDLYNKAVDWLRTPEAQQMIMDRTARRPLAGGVKPNEQFPTRPLVEMPFPSSREVVDELVATYLDKVRRQPVTIYVLDVSGSMSGDRLKQLKGAMVGLTESRDDNTFVRFHAREDITIVPFSSGVNDRWRVTIPQDKPDATLGQIRDYVNKLSAIGNTSLYEAMKEAYGIVQDRQREFPDAYVTVVVLTDGEANGRMRVDDFLSYYDSLPANAKVPSFTIRFGEANTKELDKVAKSTGGRSFDGTKNLSEAFRTIRGYQ